MLNCWPEACHRNENLLEANSQRIQALSDRLDTTVQQIGANPDTVRRDLRCPINSCNAATWQATLVALHRGQLTVEPHTIFYHIWEHLYAS